MEKIKQVLQKIPQKFLIIGIAVVVFGIAGGIYFFTLRNGAVQGVQSPPPVPKKVTNLLEDVKKKTDLPPDEIPTVATITDVSKLDQAFFLKAEKGDKVLMFIDSQKAYLYRPSTDQIINKGTLEIIYDETEASESAEITASDSAKQPDPTVLRVKF